MFRFLSGSLALIGSAAFSAASLADKHVALVIGVGKYDQLPKQLAKAVPDAEAVEAALKAMGFQVLLRKDPTYSEAMAAWDETLDRTKKNGVTLFYFAGHGFELSGQNYLLPRDAPQPLAQQDGPLRKGSIELQKLIGDLGRKQVEEDAIGIFIVDACRDNPFPIDVQQGESLAGASPMRPPKRMFIMYSAGVGQTSLDGDGQNSIYTTKLISYLQQKPSIALADIAQSLRFDVYREARKVKVQGRWHHQTPAYYDQLPARIDLFGERRHPVNFSSVNSAGLRFDDVAPGDVIVECNACPEMVVVPAGDFRMGSPEDEIGRFANEGPQREVTMRTPLAFGKFEITNHEWNACARTGPCPGLRGNAGVDAPTDREPVAHVSWNDAQTYVKWLSDTTKSKYRLPTEAEWEYAARAKTQSPYAFQPVNSTRAELCDFANGADLSAGPLVWSNYSCDDKVSRKVAQVGSFKQNSFGLRDMHGNVWEWTQDCWRSNYVSASADAADYYEPEGKKCASRVARGGSWRSGPSGLRSAVRNAFWPDQKRATLGFRVVRELSK